MIKKINQYRNSPKRTIVTFKNRSSIYLLKRSEMLNPSCFDDDSCGCIENCKCSTERGAYAFKLYHNYCNEDNSEVNLGNVDDTNGGKILMQNSNQSSSNGGAVSISEDVKMREKTTKGAIVCERIFRIRLCDVVAAACAALTVCVVIKAIFNRK